MSNSGDKTIAKEADAILGDNEKVLERELLGDWIVRGRHVFE